MKVMMTGGDGVDPLPTALGERVACDSWLLPQQKNERAAARRRELEKDQAECAFEEADMTGPYGNRPKPAGVEVAPRVGLSQMSNAEIREEVQRVKQMAQLFFAKDYSDFFQQIFGTEGNLAATFPDKGSRLVMSGNRQSMVEETCGGAKSYGIQGLEMNKVWFDDELGEVLRGFISGDSIYLK